MEVTATTIKYFENTLKEVEDKKNERFKYATEFKELNFLFEVTKDHIVKMLYLSNNISRANSVIKLLECIDNFDCVVEIEAGIFEFSITYSVSKNVVDSLIPAIYIDKLNDIITHLSIPDSYLMTSISAEQIKLQTIAFLSPSELNPKNWENLKKKQELQEYKKKNMGSTDLYQCHKCGKRKCQIMQMQTRSADEKMTLFVTCLVCYSTFTK